MEHLGREGEREPIKQKVMTVGLYPDDIEAVNRIRQFHKLENFGQAVRRAIRDTAEQVDARTQAEREELAVPA